MLFSWIFGVLLLIQPVASPDNLQITKDGQTLSVLNREEFQIANPGFPLLDNKKFTQLVETIEKKVYVAPIDAKLDKNKNIVPEQVGFQLNHHEFIKRFYDYFFAHRTTNLEVPIYSIYPKVDSELLADIRSIRIGRYITSFNTSNTNRSTNIKLAVEALNNSVVFPGETFSFNRTVGKRTIEKGYMKAKVIVKGEYAEDIGGGICQVSSTLFNAVDSAGLKIIQRYSHTRHVPYIPPGRDATVSWYGPDFEFKNLYNQPILIQARTMGNLLVIALYSSDVIEYKPKSVPFPPL